jgi:cytochrome c553
MRALTRRARWLGVGAALLGSAAAGAIAVAWSGVYDISARRGHWPITFWFLSFGMRNSVETHAIPIAVPPLDDPAQLHLGIRHYDAACAECHGAPGKVRNPIALQAIPVPPFLPDTVTEWKPAELFWIVANGLKYTGMPAWPAPERSDEVWAVVTALIHMSELDAAGYRKLVRGETRLDERVEETPRLIATAGPVGESLLACARCHGLRGEGGGAGAFPRLAGQSEAYLLQALRDYALGVRQSGVMQPVAAGLAREDMQKLAAYFASMTPPAAAPAPGADPAQVSLGRALALDGRAGARAPACAGCHGPKEGPRDPLIPSLAGQPPAYLARQLRLFRDGVFDGTPHARAMQAAARHLTDEEIESVSLFYSAG